MKEGRPKSDDPSGQTLHTCGKECERQRDVVLRSAHDAVLCTPPDAPAPLRRGLGWGTRLGRRLGSAARRSAVARCTSPCGHNGRRTWAGSPSGPAGRPTTSANSCNDGSRQSSVILLAGTLSRTGPRSDFFFWGGARRARTPRGPRGRLRLRNAHLLPQRLDLHLEVRGRLLVVRAVLRPLLRDMAQNLKHNFENDTSVSGVACDYPGLNQQCAT